MRTSQPGGFEALLFCASCTTARISASVCEPGQGEGEGLLMGVAHSSRLRSHASRVHNVHAR